MKTKKTVILISLLILVSLLLISGCKSSSNASSESVSASPEEVASKFLMSYATFDYKTTTNQPGQEYATSAFKSELNQQEATTMSYIKDNMISQRVIDYKLGTIDKSNPNICKIEYEYTVQGTSNAVPDLKYTYNGLLYLSNENNHWLVNSIQENTDNPQPSKYGASVLFDAGRDSYDKFIQKVNMKFSGGTPNDGPDAKMKGNTAKRILKGKTIILMEFPGSATQDPSVKTLFTGLAGKDANYINIKKQDGKMLVLIHAENKAKLLSIIESTAIDLTQESYKSL